MQGDWGQKDGGPGRVFQAPAAAPGAAPGPASVREPLSLRESGPDRAELTISSPFPCPFSAPSRVAARRGYFPRLPGGQGCHAPDAGALRKGWGNHWHMLEKPDSCHHLLFARQARKNGVFGGFYPIVAPRCFALAKQGTTASITRVRGTPQDVDLLLELGLHDKNFRSPPRFVRCRTGKICHSSPVPGVTVSSGIPAA